MRQCFPELLLVSCAELIKESLCSIVEHCNSLVSYCLVLSHVSRITCSFAHLYR